MNLEGGNHDLAESSFITGSCETFSKRCEHEMNEDALLPGASKPHGKCSLADQAEHSPCGIGGGRVVGLQKHTAEMNVSGLMLL